MKAQNFIAILSHTSIILSCFDLQDSDAYEEVNASSLSFSLTWEFIFKEYFKQN